MEQGGVDPYNVLLKDQMTIITQQIKQQVLLFFMSIEKASALAKKNTVNYMSLRQN